jgi:hypothetical protein
METAPSDATTPSSRGGERRTTADAVDGDTIDEVRALLLKVRADVTKKKAKIVGSYSRITGPPDLDASFSALMLLDER